MVKSRQMEAELYKAIARFLCGRPRITKPLRNGNQPAVFYLYDL